MVRFLSPSNRITVEAIGTKPLDHSDHEWLIKLARALEARLNELDQRLRNKS